MERIQLTLSAVAVSEVSARSSHVFTFLTHAIVSCCCLLSKRNFFSSFEEVLYIISPKIPIHSQSRAKIAWRNSMISNVTIRWAAKMKKMGHKRGGRAEDPSDVPSACLSSPFPVA